MTMQKNNENANTAKCRYFQVEPLEYETSVFESAVQIFSLQIRYDFSWKNNINSKYLSVINILILIFFVSGGGES